MDTQLVDARQLPAEMVQGQDLHGECAICKDFTIVRYCSKCAAVFCEECRHRYFRRGAEAIMSMLGVGSHGRVKWVVQ